MAAILSLHDLLVETDRKLTAIARDVNDEAANGGADASKND